MHFYAWLAVFFICFCAIAVGSYILVVRSYYWVHKKDRGEKRK